MLKDIKIEMSAITTVVFLATFPDLAGYTGRLQYCTSHWQDNILAVGLKRLANIIK